MFLLYTNVIKMEITLLNLLQQHTIIHQRGGGVKVFRNGHDITLKYLKRNRAHWPGVRSSTRSEFSKLSMDKIILFTVTAIDQNDIN